VRSKVDERVLLTLYNVLILPHLMYCNIVWGSASKTILDPLVKLQKRAVRIIARATYIAHTNPLFGKYCILKLEDMYRLQMLLFVYNCRFPPCAKSICNFYYRFQFLSSFSNYSTRNSERTLYIPYFRTEIRRNSTKIMGAYINNSCLNLTDMPSSDIMKSYIKKYFINSYNDVC